MVEELVTIFIVTSVVSFIGVIIGAALTGNLILKMIAILMGVFSAALILQYPTNYTQACTTTGTTNDINSTATSVDMTERCLISYTNSTMLVADATQPSFMHNFILVAAFMMIGLTLLITFVVLNEQTDLFMLGKTPKPQEGEP